MVHRSGGAKVDWGTDIGAVGGWGVESNSTNRPSHHKSSKQCPLIAYLKTSGVNGSKTT